MGRVRKRIRGNSALSDDEDHETEDLARPGPSRISSTQPIIRSRRSTAPEFLTQTTEDLDDEGIQILENNCIQKLLMKIDSMKPFKSSDLFSGLNLKPRRQAVILERMKRTLLDKFGVELLQLEGKSFIVVTPQTSEIHNAPVEPTNYDIFLNMILTIIYMHKGKISEELLLKTILPKLFPHLAKVGCKDNVPKMLHEMEIHLFIRKEQNKASDSKVLYWGLRAIKEFDKKLMIPIICQLGNVEENSIPTSLFRAIENNVDYV